MKVSRRVGAVCAALLLLAADAHPGASQAARAGAAQAARGGFVDVDGGRIYYEAAGETAGDREAVVFLHGGLTHGGVWEAQFLRFARDFRVVRYDRRGHGRSDVAAGPYRPAGDLHALLDHLGIERAVLVGSSAGGRLALDFALAHPERVSRLVLVGAVVSGYGFSDHFRERGRRNMAPLADGDVEAAVANWAGDPHLIAPGNPEVRQRFRALVEPHARKWFLERAPELARPSGPPALGRLAEIEVPTLVVVGAEDVPDVHAHAGVLEAGIDGSRRVVVPGAGHLVALERPEAFERHVLDFLRSR